MRPPLLITVLCRNVLLNLSNERWQSFLHSFPEDVQIDVEISVDRAVPHTDNLVLGQVGQLCSGLWT